MKSVRCSMVMSPLSAKSETEEQNGRIRRGIKFTIPSVHLRSPACSRCSCQQRSSWPCTPRPWSWSLPPACRRHPRDKTRCVAWRNIYELAPLKSQVRHTHTFTLVLQSSCAMTPARSENSRTKAPQIDRMLGSHFVVDAVHLSWWSKTLGSSPTTTQTFRIQRTSCRPRTAVLGSSEWRLCPSLRPHPLRPIWPH